MFFDQPDHFFASYRKQRIKNFLNVSQYAEILNIELGLTKKKHI